MMIQYFDKESREDTINNRRTAQQILAAVDERVFVMGHTRNFGRDDDWVKDYLITLKNPKNPQLVITEKDGSGTPRYVVPVNGSATVREIYSLASEKVNSVYEKAYEDMLRGYLREQGYRPY